MNGKERDEHLARQTAAAEAQARGVRLLERALSAPERRVRDRETVAAFPPARLLFGGERGAVALLRSIPGFAGLWERVVPEGYLRRVRARDGSLWTVVACPCGEHPALAAGALGECPCGRWYFSTGGGVRVKRFELEGAAA